MPRRRRGKPPEPPELPELDWIEYGGQEIFVVGYTEGGVPYGLTRAEHDAAERGEDLAGMGGERDVPDEDDSDDDTFGEAPDWQVAKEALHQAIALAAPGARPHVGHTKRIGEGLDRVVFAAHVELEPDRLAIGGTYVVHLRRQRDDARVRREAALLERLAELELPFAVPRVLSLVPTARGLVMIEEALWGVPLPSKAGVLPGVPAPWKVAGRLAAQVHAIDPGLVRELVPAHETRRAHALAKIAVLESAPEPELRRAHAWAMENLPPDEPSVFLHGDLLGQNALLRPEEPTALIDWDQAQLGDPAYELAILTRGVRHPFKEKGGREKLLEAYRAAGGREISWREVRIFELGMIASWYRETFTRDPRSGDVEQLLQRVANLTP